MRYARIDKKTNKVVNIIEAGVSSETDAHYDIASDVADIDDSYENDKLTPKPVNKVIKTEQEIWDTDMRISDKGYATPKDIARFMEDFYDSNPDVYAVKPRSFKDKHTERKAIRGRKPK